MKDVHKVYKALCAIVLAVAIVFTPFVCKTPDLQAEAGSTLAALKAKFPDGKYWNHYVKNASEAADALGVNKNEAFRTRLLPTAVHCTVVQATHTMSESMIAITLTAVGSALASQESWDMKRMEKEFLHGALQPLFLGLKQVMS